MDLVFPRSFYARRAEIVARDLLGAVITHGDTSGRIVETEAYLGAQDRAAHSYRGETPRTKVIFGEPGHAYVYFIYGMYECLNAVTVDAECVLIRALEPVTGIDIMRSRRKRDKPRELTSGPGKLTLALGITRALNGADLTNSSLVISRGTPPDDIAIGPRIGIRHCAEWPLRFWIKGNPFVSGPLAQNKAAPSPKDGTGAAHAKPKIYLPK